MTSTSGSAAPHKRETRSARSTVRPRGAGTRSLCKDGSGSTWLILVPGRLIAHPLETPEITTLPGPAVTAAWSRRSVPPPGQHDKVSGKRKPDRALRHHVGATNPAFPVLPSDGLDLLPVDPAVTQRLAVMVHAPAEQKPVTAVLRPVFVAELYGRKLLQEPIGPSRGRRRRYRVGRAGRGRRTADDAARTPRFGRHGLVFGRGALSRRRGLLPAVLAIVVPGRIGDIVEPHSAPA